MIAYEEIHPIVLISDEYVPIYLIWRRDLMMTINTVIVDTHFLTKVNDILQMLNIKENVF
jgi:hypothetical protein